MSRRPSDLYEQELNESRERFDSSPIVRKLSRWGIDPLFLELFAIYYSSLSSGLAQNVPNHMAKAAERSKALGFGDFSPWLKQHAAEEVGHDAWGVSDVNRLVAIWNERRKPRLDATEILSQRRSPAVRRYHQLHRDVINSDVPYADMAIVLELERVAVKYGPRMIFRSLFKLGPKILWNMTFLRKHVNADFWHSRVNLRVLDELLGPHPEYLPALAEAGKGGVNAYLGFLIDCDRLAEEKYKTLRAAKAKLVAA